MTLETGAVGPQVGAAAPSLCLPSHFGEALSFGECRLRAGAEQILAVFFPFAYSPVCTAEMEQLAQLYDDLLAGGTEVAAVSCDPKYTLAAWAQDLRLPFVLLSDFWPHGAASKAFGAFDERRGFAQRLTFLLDGSGVVVDTEHSLAGSKRDFTRFLNRSGGF
ncbi:redoxin domain-containing protein [Brevibacterium sp. HMSC07C04]|uniref:redoxin domain-containing protein n=1 Tax=Brevibacterium sp. HMSC07C04 TaxID=1581130 RepID=UPI0008A2EE36|nr:redoxin domain-containing protein [Brevibacterium sp. HMSC07C04]OFS26335.1 hypothetical protein HMPREF3162_05990 [Brevibacterium sp. HMSC07C04]